MRANKTDGQRAVVRKPAEGRPLLRSTTDERGASLVAVLAIVTAVLLIGAALFVLGTGESDVVEYGVDNARAFYLAEGGVERARTWLEDQAQQIPPYYPANGEFADQALGGGQYDVQIGKLTTANPWAIWYDVLSTGEVDGVVRQVHAVLRSESFAQYMYFADHMDDIWFITGDSLDGRVHANGHIRLSGSPWFGMKVTSAQNNFIIWQDSEPIFEAGYELGVPEIPLPITNELVAELTAEAIAGGFHAGSLTGNQARYEVELGRNGNLGYLYYRAYEKQGSQYHWSPWSSVSIESTNGIVWFDERVDLKGVLDGELTIGSSDDIYIVDDITYADSVPGQGPIVGGSDILGIVSAENIIIAENTPNYDDVEIHAHMMALHQSFTVEDYTHGPARGDLILYGGFAQKKQGAVGMFHHNGTLVHGYQKNYHYDPNLLVNSPPGYPPTGKYLIVSWEEVYPPVI
ncbi:MAG: DUF4900 domain-containing protein [Candidatus Eisenbacteria bacterium]